MSLATAFRAFFAALFNREVADQIRSVLDQSGAPPGLPEPAPTPAPPAAERPKPRPARSDAVTLLAALQREARLVDLIKENLSQYSDAQIGAAARPCLQQCAATLDRLVGIKAIETAADGQTITVAESAAPSRYLWLGEGSGSQGKLVHHGWEATQVELPQWTGIDADVRVIAPVQVQRS